MTETLHGVVSASQIARDGPNLLLFCPTNGPVFSISPAGKVSLHRLKVEGDYRLHTVKACTDGDEFHFLRANEKTRTLELVKLAPAAKQTRTKTLRGDEAYV